MMRHTPGPWIATVCADGTSCVDDEPGTLHAEVWVITSVDRTAADARLMAAAPELLVACHAAVAYDVAMQRAAAQWETHITHNDGTTTVRADELDDLYADWMLKARAAIVKAVRQP